MFLRPQSLYALSIPATLALVAALAWGLARPVPAAPPLTAPPARFDAARAEQWAQNFAAQFPRRVVGSAEAVTAQRAIAGQFAALGLAPATLPFSVTVASQARAGAQVWATRAGQSDSIILIMAAGDTPAQGGRDNAAGLAALLELARVYASASPRHTLMFMLTDASEYGRAWGTQTWLAQSPLRGRIAAALALDAQPGQDWARIQVTGAGFLSGYAPLWLRQAGIAAVEAAGGQPSEPRGLDEFVARALPFAMTDTGQVLRAGLPALSFSGQPGAASPDALGVFGRATENWIERVDAQAGPATEAAGDWRLTDGHSLPGAAASALTLLLFAPLFLLTGFTLWRQRPRRGDLMPELTALAGAALPLVNGYAVGYILLQLGWLPRYETFPAAPGDRFLLQPADWAMVLILVTIGVSAWDVFGRLRGWGRLADRLLIPTRRVTLLSVFSALALALWLADPFAAALLLAPAAYLWPWIAPQPVPAGRALNLMLGLGGLLPFVGVCVGVALTPGLGLWWWFLTAGAIYGLFSWPVIGAWALGLALCLRFIRFGWPITPGL